MTFDPSTYSALELQKLDIANQAEAIRAKAGGDTAKLEYKVANILNTSRDLGYAAALIDVMNVKPDPAGFKTAREYVTAWVAAIQALAPQFPA